ncbi:MAG: HEAT repeat domain-containing protein [Candidatus Odinarchaeota archaeon]
MTLENNHLSNSIALLIRELEQTGYGTTRSARLLVDIGKPAVQPLVDILENEDAWIHERASEFSNDQARQERLSLTNQLALEYIYWRISREIIIILGDIGEPLATGSLIKIARSRTYGQDFRCLAIESLGKIKNPSAIEPLIELLNNYDENMKVNFEAVTALGMFDDQKAIDALVKAAVTSTVPQFRDRIIKTIIMTSPSIYFLPICSCLMAGGAGLEEEMLQKMLELLVNPLKREVSPLHRDPALQACLIKLEPFFLSILFAGSPDIRMLAKILLHNTNGIEETSDS